MPFCPECGKPVATNSKFCRNCGAYQLEDDSSVPLSTPVAAPAPVASPPPPPQPRPVPPQVVVQPIVQSVCSSCGSPLSPSEKFCGICGSRVDQITPASPPASSPINLVYAPVFAPSEFQSPAPVMGEPAGVRTCTACGTVIKPGDKYCSKCLVMVRDNQPAAPVRAPVQTPPVVSPAPSEIQSPAPVMGEPAGVRTCTACGTVIKPGDKYCSKCLVMVRDNQPAAPVRAPVQTPPVVSPASYVCASCGSPMTGAEKFCGACGATVAARVPAAAPLQPIQKTCSACGAPVNDTTKFCGGCGAPVGASFRTATVTSPAPYSGIAPPIPISANFSSEYLYKERK